MLMYLGVNQRDYRGCDPFSTPLSDKSIVYLNGEKLRGGGFTLINYWLN